MAYKSIRVSDLSGATLADDQVVTVVVRAAGKLFDASSEELTGLKPLTDVVELEYRYPDGKTQEVIVSKSSFDKLVTPEMLANADSIRGRRNGFRPGAD